MITFREFVKKNFKEDIVGLYPPLYGGIGNYPINAQKATNRVYIQASLDNAKKRKRKKKKRRK